MADERAGIRSVTAAEMKSGVEASAGKPLVLLVEDLHAEDPLVEDPRAPSPPSGEGAPQADSSPAASSAASSGSSSTLTASAASSSALQRDGIARVRKPGLVTLRIAAPACVGTALVVLDAKGAALDLSKAAPRGVPQLSPTVLVVPEAGGVSLRDLPAQAVTVLLLPASGSVDKARGVAARSREVLSVDGAELGENGLRVAVDLESCAGEGEFVLAISREDLVHFPRCC